jgi:hypothetical protein
MSGRRRGSSKKSRAASPETEARVAEMQARVRAELRDRPGVYRMLSPDGEIIYVGKSKKLRTRLLGYFRAEFPLEKGARIIREAGEIEWDYQPSEFAALLEEVATDQTPPAALQRDDEARCQTLRLYSNLERRGAQVHGGAQRRQ